MKITEEGRLQSEHFRVTVIGRGGIPTEMLVLPIYLPSVHTGFGLMVQLLAIVRTAP